MVKCCVSGCKKPLSKDVKYFKFPTSRNLRRKWEAAIKVNGRKSSGGSVCSRHFLPADYQHVRGKVRLKAAVVPSVFAVELKKHTANNISTNKDTIDPTKNPTPEEKQDKSPIKEKLDNLLPKVINSNIKDTSIKKDKPPEEISLKNKCLERESSPKESSIDGVVEKGINEIETTEHKDTHTNRETDIEENDNSIKALTEPENDIKNQDTIDKSEPKNERDNDTEKDNNKIGVSDNVNSDINKNLSVTENVSVRRKSATEKSIDNKNGGSIDENQDIEELLTDYRIYQNNIHSIDDDEVQPLEHEPECIVETFEGDLPHNSDPVFIELAVDKESANDCLMVMESVQVEIDPSTLLQGQDFEVASVDLDNDDDDEVNIVDEVSDVAEVNDVTEVNVVDEVNVDDEVTEVKDVNTQKEPISLLTSSDEDDVIIQEPKIDTVEVSDETDEDDMPLVKLVKKKKKKLKKKRKAPDTTDKLSRIMAWNMCEYFCVECHFRTIDRSEYNKHRLEHAKVLLMCQLCGYMTSSEVQLTKHEKQHKDYKRYQCHLCDYKAKHNMSLMYHMRSHNLEKSYKCFKCGYKTKNEGEFVRHMVLCKGVDGKKHCCNRCDYRTSKPSDLRRHKSRIHKDSDSDDEYVP